MKREHTKYFEKGVRQNWHHCRVFKEAVLTFSQNHARQPDMLKAKLLHKKIMKRVEEELKELNIFSKLEFVGSTYEGVKVSDLEFDVMVIMKMPVLVKEQLQNRPNFALLKLDKQAFEHTDKEKSIDFINGSDYILSSKIRDFFFRHLQRCCNALDETIILRKHGPAIQMDVCKTSESLIYSVDIVPTLAVHDEFYVAKQLKSESSYNNDLMWRRTYSLEEKDILSNIDSNNGCRKQVLRIIKAIRNNEPSLQKVTSYVLKNVVLRVHTQLSPINLKDRKDPWHIDNIGSRLMDVIKKLKDEFNDGVVPCYFDSKINLIEDLKPITIENIRNRFKHLANSYKKMNKALQVK